MRISTTAHHASDATHVSITDVTHQHHRPSRDCGFHQRTLYERYYHTRGPQITPNQISPANFSVPARGRPKWPQKCVFSYVLPRGTTPGDVREGPRTRGQKVWSMPESAAPRAFADTYHQDLVRPSWIALHGRRTQASLRGSFGARSVPHTPPRSAERPRGAAEGGAMVWGRADLAPQEPRRLAGVRRP